MSTFISIKGEGGMNRGEAGLSEQTRKQIVQLKRDLSSNRDYGFSEADFTPEVLEAGGELLVREWNSPESGALRRKAAGFMYFHDEKKFGVKKAVERGTPPLTLAAVGEFIRDQGRTVNIPPDYEFDMAVRLEGEVKDFKGLYSLAQRCAGLIKAYKIELERVTKDEPVKEETFWTVADMGLTEKRDLSDAARKALLVAENLREAACKEYIIGKLQTKIELLEQFMNETGEKIREQCVSAHFYEYLQSRHENTRLALAPGEVEFLLKCKQALLNKLTSEQAT